MFLKNKNIIFKIRRSNVTDNAALKIIFSSKNYNQPEIKTVILLAKICLLAEW